MERAGGKAKNALRPGARVKSSYEKTDMQSADNKKKNNYTNFNTI